MIAGRAGEHLGRVQDWGLVCCLPFRSSPEKWLQLVAKIPLKNFVYIDIGVGYQVSYVGGACDAMWEVLCDLEEPQRTCEQVPWPLEPKSGV